MALEERVTHKNPPVTKYEVGCNSEVLIQTNSNRSLKDTRQICYMDKAYARCLVGQAEQI